MKVLLVQQDLGVREAKIPIWPIGLTYIATALQDHEVKIFDPNLYPVATAMSELKSLLIDFNPDVAGISIRNIDTTNFRYKRIYFETVKPTISLLKECNPKLKIMVGGSGFSMFPEIIMKKIPSIDFGIYLEGEETTVELLEHLNNPEQVKGLYLRKDKKVIFTGTRDFPEFDKIQVPTVPPEVIDLKRYLGPSYNIIGIQTKRGCMLNCAYCSYPHLNGKCVRLQNPVVIVDQIEYFINEFGMQRFVFVDSVFNVPEDHARAVLLEMVKRKLEVEFGVWCHMKNISLEFLELLKKAGAIQIDFSPDAATDKGLSCLNKGLNEQDIKKAISLTRKVKGISVGFGLFNSLPGYNLRDTLKTIVLPFLIQFALPGRGGGGIGFIRIEPDTEIREIAVQEGLIDKDDDLFPDTIEDMEKMFYRPPAQWHLNLITDAFLIVFERILKPVAVFVFSLLKRLTGKKGGYDQKTGFSAYQIKKK